jgi:hypothetical protein
MAMDSIELAVEFKESGKFNPGAGYQKTREH